MKRIVFLSFLSLYSCKSSTENREKISDINKIDESSETYDVKLDLLSGDLENVNIFEEKTSLDSDKQYAFISLPIDGIYFAIPFSKKGSLGLTAFSSSQTQKNKKISRKKNELHKEDLQNWGEFEFEVVDRESIKFKDLVQLNNKIEILRNNKGFIEDSIKGPNSRELVENFRKLQDENKIKRELKITEAQQKIKQENNKTREFEQANRDIDIGRRRIRIKKNGGLPILILRAGILAGQIYFLYWIISSIKKNNKDIQGILGEDGNDENTESEASVTGLMVDSEGNVVGKARLPSTAVIGAG